MSKIKNEIILHNGYVEVKITKTGMDSYCGTVLIDTEDLIRIGKLRLTAANYTYTCKDSINVAHLVLNHTSNKETVVDHINGNRLDNRKSNLRIVSIKDNAKNRTTTGRNNTGVVGISLKEINNYTFYRATFSDRKTPMKGAKSKTKQISKNFNIKTLGKEQAFSLAKEWLEKMKTAHGYYDF